jgi:hypothetical protein
MKNGLYTIKTGNFNSEPQLPFFHNGWWFNKRTTIKIQFNKDWNYLFRDADGHPLVKANMDIQKWVGYSLDPLRKSIIRIGCSNGYSNVGANNKYDGVHLFLHAYLTKNWSHYRPKGFGRMIIGKIRCDNPAQGVTITHQLTEEGFPYFAVVQGNYIAETITRAMPFSPSFNGLNMNPYVEYDNMGAPADLRLNMGFTQEDRKPDATIGLYGTPALALPNDAL